MFYSPEFHEEDCMDLGGLSRNQRELSTSTLTQAHSRAAIFGPVHPEGYGVYYAQPGGELHFTTTAYQPRSAARFNGEVEAALRHVESLLDSESPSAAWIGAATARLKGLLAALRQATGI